MAISKTKVITGVNTRLSISTAGSLPASTTDLRDTPFPYLSLSLTPKQ